MRDERHVDGKTAMGATKGALAEPRSPEPRLGARTRARLNFYMLSWITLAAFAFGYIGVAATRPDLLPGVIPLNDGSGEQMAGGRTVSDMAEELAALRTWVNDLQHEVVATRNAQQQTEQQQQALLQRMAATEEKLQGPIREIHAEAPPASAPAKGRTVAEAKTAHPAIQVGTSAGTLAGAAVAPQAVASAAARAEVKSEEIAAVAAPTAGVKVINGGATSDIVTSSVLPADAAPAQPVKAVAPHAAAAPAATAGHALRGIEIADSESLEGLRSRWSALSNQNAAVLKKLEPRYRISGANNGQNPFTLLAGPFANSAEAAKSCAQLRANGVNCRVGDYNGNGL